jgi:hypothetical protein
MSVSSFISYLIAQIQSLVGLAREYPLYAVVGSVTGLIFLSMWAKTWGK